MNTTRIVRVGVCAVVMSGCGGAPSSDASGESLQTLVSDGGGLASCPSAASYRDDLITAGSVLPRDLNTRFGGSATACTGQTEMPCAPHTVFVREQRPRGVALRDPLVLFLPGTGNRPDNMTYVQRAAAFAGYRTIGLSYDNTSGMAETCGSVDREPLQRCALDCPTEARREVFYGNTTSAFRDVMQGDAILERLHLLLRHLDATYPAGHWHDYYRDTQGAPLAASDIRWDRIIVAGFSQGAGHAAFISKAIARVHGVVLMDSEVDACRDDNAAAPFTTDSARPARWLADPRDLSAGRPRAAVRKGVGINNESMWPLLGITSVGPAAENLDTAVRPMVGLPLDGAFTYQAEVWTRDNVCGLHKGMAIDQCMPTTVTSGVRANTASGTWLFEPYLRRFCAVCPTCP